MTKTKLSMCGDIVRGRDHDRFLAGLLSPAGCRDALWALYAFNYEVARVRETVSDTTLGLIRLQWWRDGLAAVYQGKSPPHHPVLEALSIAIRHHDLPRDWFDAMLYAREFDLEDKQPETMQGLEHYAEFTGAPLLRLALRVTGHDEDTYAAPVAKAYAMTGLLRAVLFHAGQRRCYLPSDLLLNNGVAVESLYAGQTQGLSPVIRTVALQAKAILADCKPGPKLARVMAAQARLHLGHMDRLGYDVLDARMAMAPPFYAARLLLA